MRYGGCNLEPLPDLPGYVQVHDTPYCFGREVHICTSDGRRFFSRSSLYPGMPHKNSIDGAWRWPLVAPTCVIPNVGERLWLLGGLSAVTYTHLADDSFANDALWRKTPSVIWRTALQVESAHTLPAPDPFHNGGYAKTGRCEQRKQRKRRVERNQMARWNSRCMMPDVRELGKLRWPNVQLPRRLSVELGINGTVRRPITQEFYRSPGSSALSEAHSLGNEDYTASSTWLESEASRYPARELYSLSREDIWLTAYPSFPYKKIWYAQQSVDTGLYGFACEPTCANQVVLFTTRGWDLSIYFHRPGL